MVVTLVLLVNQAEAQTGKKVGLAFGAGLGGGVALGRLPLVGGGLNDGEYESGVIKYLSLQARVNTRLGLGVRASEWSVGLNGYPRYDAITGAASWCLKSDRSLCLDGGVGLSRAAQRNASEYGVVVTSGIGSEVPLTKGLFLSIRAAVDSHFGYGREVVIPSGQVGLTVNWFGGT